MLVAKLLLAGVLAAGAAEAPANPPASKDTQIDWARLPSAEVMAHYYPPRAKAAGLGGWAIITCRADPSGKLHGCKVADEAPAGFGFGAATLAAAPTFEMSVPSAVTDLRVLVPMIWRLPEGRNPPPPPTVGSSAFVVTINDKPRKNAQTFACPTAQNPGRTCQAHGAKFERAPGIVEIADLIRKAGGGSSDMECTVGDTGALRDCVAADNGPHLTVADFHKLSMLFKASAKTSDGLATAGKHVVVRFDWTWLDKILAVYDAT